MGNNSFIPGKIILIFFTVAQFSTIAGNAQSEREEQDPELALGVRAVTRQITYDKHKLFVTDPTSIGLQTMVRYDSPVKTGKNYIDVVAEAGFLFCKANSFDTAYTDPNSGILIRERSRNPTYLPVYFGVYNIAPLSIGAELFYWKGLGNRDIWGIKFLSVGYKATTFRAAIAGEIYSQVKNGKNSGVLLSFDFYWKLIKGYSRRKSG